MATNKADKNKGKKGEAKGTRKGLMEIAEVRMVLYVVPVAIILALFVYFTSK